MNVATRPAPVRHAQPAGGGAGQIVALVLSWTAVGLPLLWGVAETLNKALALFQ
jgi:hypothetical protein